MAFAHKHNLVVSFHTLKACGKFIVTTSTSLDNRDDFVELRQRQRCVKFGGSNTKPRHTKPEAARSTPNRWVTL